MQSDTSYINLEYSTLNTIESNTIHRTNNQAISLSFSTQNKILNNKVSGSEPIELFQSSDDNLIEHNTTSGTSSGIYISGSNNNIVQFNESYQSGAGIVLNHGSTGNDIHDNIFRNNTDGVRLFFRSVSNNLIYNNNFINNLNALNNGGTSHQVFFQQPPIGGNYWSQFNEDNEGCHDVNNDNICDTQFAFGDAGNNIDSFPWKISDGWKVKMSSEKAITSFNFQSLTPAVAGVVNETNHTIALTVPFGIDVTALAPTIAVSTGASVNPNTNVAQNFTAPVVYTVTAENSTTQKYTVTVVVAPRVRNPVIIVPGVLGTDISQPTDSGSKKLWLDLSRNFSSDSDNFMDALQFNSDLTPSDTTLTIGDVVRKATTLFGHLTLFDYTFSLVQEFQNQGYVEGTDLFLFPYDWRYGVSEDNVVKLKQKIADVLAKTGAEKVDIIAHSTGGLIVKKYVVENPSNNRIDKAVFVGVPNTGAPKAIKALVAGDDFGNYLVADSEMKKIARNFPVAYDLLPSRQYFDIKGSYVKVINRNDLTDNVSQNLDFDKVTSFLTVDHQLNSKALTNAHNLHTAGFDNYDMRTAGVNLYAIDGCKVGTIGKFIETRSQNILGNSNPTVNYSLETVPGDGTVPLESATNLLINDANKYYILAGTHGDLLSQEGSRQQIVNIISGSALATKNITQDISKCKLNGRAISVFSPLSISIVDQDGNHAGLASDGVSIENNIPNADFEIIGEHKFVYLPTDNGQTYTISIAGTGTGTFTITDATISNSSITQTQVFSNISVTPQLLGHISLSNNTNTTLSLDTDGNGITDSTLQPSSVLDAAQSQNFVPSQPVASTIHVPMGSAGLVSTPVPVVAENNVIVAKVENVTVPQPAITPEIKEVVLIKAPEAQIQTLITKQANNSVVAMPVKSKEKTKLILEQKQILAPKPTENPPALSKVPLTANAVDTGMPVSSKVIVGGLLGLLLLLLL